MPKKSRGRPSLATSRATQETRTARAATVARSVRTLEDDTVPETAAASMNSISENGPSEKRRKLSVARKEEKEKVKLNEYGLPEDIQVSASLEQKMWKFIAKNIDLFDVKSLQFWRVFNKNHNIELASPTLFQQHFRKMLNDGAMWNRGYLNSEEMLRVAKLLKLKVSQKQHDLLLKSIEEEKLNIKIVIKNKMISRWYYKTDAARKKRNGPEAEPVITRRSNSRRSCSAMRVRSISPDAPIAPIAPPEEENQPDREASHSRRSSCTPLPHRSMSRHSRSGSPSSAILRRLRYTPQSESRQMSEERETSSAARRRSSRSVSFAVPDYDREEVVEEHVADPVELEEGNMHNFEELEEGEENDLDPVELEDEHVHNFVEEEEEEEEENVQNPAELENENRDDGVEPEQGAQRYKVFKRDPDDDDLTFSKDEHKAMWRYLVYRALNSETRAPTGFVPVTEYESFWSEFLDYFQNRGEIILRTPAVMRIYYKRKNKELYKENMAAWKILHLYQILKIPTNETNRQIMEESFNVTLIVEYDLIVGWNQR